MSALRAEHDELESQLLVLERAIEGLHPPLRLADMTGGAYPEAVELAERAAALLLRLGLVNDALAAMDAAQASGRR